MQSRVAMDGQTATGERRSETRRCVDVGCKVQHSTTARFLAGRAVNLSRTGALLSVRCARAVRPGDRLRLGLAWSGGVLRGESLSEGEVVRAGSLIGGVQEIAVRFDRPMALSAVARAVAAA